MLRRRAPFAAALAALVVAVPVALAGGGKVTATVSQSGTAGTLTVKNTGATTIKYVYFHPHGGTVTATPKANGGSASDGDGMWNGLELKPGQSVTLTFTVKGTMTGGGISVNDHVGNDGMSPPMTVTKGGRGGKTPPPKQAPAAAKADLELTVQAVLPHPNGTTPGVRVVIRVRNRGPAKAEGIFVGKNYRPGVTSGSCTGDCQVGALAPGASHLFTLDVEYKGHRPGESVEIELDVTSSTPDPNGKNNTDTASAKLEKP